MSNMAAMVSFWHNALRYGRHMATRSGSTKELKRSQPRGLLSYVYLRTGAAATGLLLPTSLAAVTPTPDSGVTGSVRITLTVAPSFKFVRSDGSSLTYCLLSNLGSAAVRPTMRIEHAGSNMLPPGSSALDLPGCATGSYLAPEAIGTSAVIIVEAQ